MSWSSMVEEGAGRGGRTRTRWRGPKDQCRGRSGVSRRGAAGKHEVKVQADGSGGGLVEWAWAGVKMRRKRRQGLG